MDMTLSIVKKQRLLYGFMIVITAAIAVLLFRETEKKWIFFQQAEKNFSKGNFEIAIEFYHKSLAMGLSTPQVYHHLADAQFKLAQVLSWNEQYNEAATLYQELLKREPENIQFRRHYARLLIWMGQHREAAEEMKRTLPQEP